MIPCCACGSELIGMTRNPGCTGDCGRGTTTIALQKPKTMEWNGLYFIILLRCEYFIISLVLHIINYLEALWHTSESHKCFWNDTEECNKFGKGVLRQNKTGKSALKRKTNSVGCVGVTAAIGNVWMTRCTCRWCCGTTTYKNFVFVKFMLWIRGLPVVVIHKIAWIWTIELLEVTVLITIWPGQLKVEIVAGLVERLEV